MQYFRELSFLKDVFEKSRLHTELLPARELGRFFDGNKENISPLSSFSEELRHGILYKFSDSFECRYCALMLPESEKDEILILGPYLSENMSKIKCLEIAERLGVSPKEKKHLQEYYMSIPVLPEDSPLMIMLTSFCERIWKNPAFSVVELGGEESSYAPLSKSMSDIESSDTFINMKTMEHRYAFENEMIRAVELGFSQSEFPLGSVSSGEFFEKRVDDPLRNSKNYGIIMNTLLRKAAERGGVHPIYIDKVSSEFALRLEKASAVSENAALMMEMFRTYCRLVRKHRLNGYSPTVQKIILSIDADLSENLSAGALAKRHGISLGYLSAVFKKETGKTVSEYIRERRMEYARHLLKNTNLQVQTVAFNSGVVDVQYFSKLFKRHYGKTPSEYRLSQKANNN